MFKKIVHLQFAGPYSEGYNYQENILPKYQKEPCNEVEVWTCDYAWEKGQLKKVPLCDKVMSDGVRLVRFEYKKYFLNFITNKLRNVQGIYERLVLESPDFIMLHDVQSAVLKQVARYMAENPEVKLIVDCHADYSNSARNWLSRNILHKLIYRSYVKKIEPFVYKFYGTLPARVEFLKDVYGIDEDKCDLLVMGVEDEVAETVRSDTDINSLRNRYGISSGDFLIVTGGKVDEFKTQTLTLMRAVKTLDDHVKLLVFGSIAPALQQEFDSLVDGVKIVYAGWASGNDSYKFFVSADLVVFPGRHSVYWEQAAGLGIPLVVKYWPGTDHVDLGGNVKFLYDDSVDEIGNVLTDITSDSDLYKTMKTNAISKGIECFSYKKIALKCLND